MRPAPAFVFEAERFGVSRVALGVLVFASVAALTGWQWLGREATSPGRLALLGLSVFAIVAAGSRLRTRRFRLRWDGQAWHVGPLATAQAEPWNGRLQVALDLGVWMLLHFVPASGPRRCPYRWLPVQRGGFEAQWHALRVAVYSARSDRPLHPGTSSPARPDSHE